MFPARYELSRKLGLGAHEPAAVLHSAVQGASTGAAAFGADAERLAETAASARSSLGHERFTAASACGHAMTTDEAVAYALDVIAQLRVASLGSGRSPTPRTSS